jgi:anti-sigma B factor antagonist
MEMQFSTLDHDIRMVKLTGKLDIIGTGEIETQFAGYCSGEKVRVIVDLAGVEFLASIGIRLLMLNAESIAKRGGKMVIIHPIPDVKHILEVTGIPDIIPVYTSLESAETVLMAPS